MEGRRERERMSSLTLRCFNAISLQLRNMPRFPVLQSQWMISSLTQQSGNDICTNSKYRANAFYSISLSSPAQCWTCSNSEGSCQPCIHFKHGG